MKENIVYILGAGFSRPLGLPLVRDFLTLSKDLYAENSQSYPHFKTVFEGIERLAKIKTFYESDQLDIEEILSILFMGTTLEESELTKDFIRYVRDVIDAYTKKQVNEGLSTTRFNPNSLSQLLFGKTQFRPYGWFVSNLLGLSYYSVYNQGTQEITIRCRTKEFDKKYSAVTLNYDLVLENMVDFIREKYCEPDQDLRLKRQWVQDGSRGGFLAKLHGSIDDDEIIPPTWNKTVMKGKVLDAWKIARDLLSNANHIRVLGYSLPSTDAYIRYLFKDSVLKSDHLKSFDVVCWDPTGAVKDNYSQFICYKEFRFVNSKIENYFDNITTSGKPLDNGNTIDCMNLELVHKAFMRRHFPE